MKIETQNELAALMLGVILGRDLEFAKEFETEQSVAFGDFEAATLLVDRTGVLELNTVDNMRGYYAMAGAVYEAENEAEQVWKEWQKLPTK